MRALFVKGVGTAPAARGRALGIAALVERSLAWGEVPVQGFSFNMDLRG